MTLATEIEDLKGELTSGSTWHAAGLVGQLRSSRNITRMLGISVELYERLENERRELIAHLRDRWLGGDLDALVSKARGLAHRLRELDQQH